MICIRTSKWKYVHFPSLPSLLFDLENDPLEMKNLAEDKKYHDVKNTLMSDLLRQLKQETFVLNIEEKSMKDLNLAGYNFIVRDEKTLEVVVDSEHGINELFDLLNSQNIKVVSLRNKSNRLEELFMKLIDAKNFDKKVTS